MDQITKVLGINSYDGNSDPVEFTKSFKLHAFMFGWDDAKQLQVLPLLLKGRAERIFNGLDNTKKAAIKDALEEIENNCVQSQEMLLNAFYSRKPAPGERLSSFANALQDLLTKAVPKLGNNEKTILLRSQLCEHLPEHLRALIHFNHNKSWDDILCALDQAMPSFQPTDPYASAASNGYGIYQPVKQEPLELNTASASKSKIVCWYCNKPGHREQDCFQKKRDEARRKDGSNRSSRYSSGNSSRNSSRNNSRNGREYADRGSSRRNHKNLQQNNSGMKKSHSVPSDVNALDLNDSSSSVEATSIETSNFISSVEPVLELATIS